MYDKENTMFAIFDCPKEITEAQLEEVRAFVEFVAKVKEK